MTTQKICAGAPSRGSVTWHSIDWAKCHREVRKLQARIVKATREGKYGKVKSLQWLLTHSFSGKTLAVRRVTENRGRKTAGVDGIRWSTPQSKSQAILSLKRYGYRPQPLKRVYIPKSNGKLRPLGIPTMKDRAMQALYLLALEPVSETTADQRSFGFRSGRSTADAIEQCFKVLARRIAPKWILEGDIKGCFDNISHDWLLRHIPTDSMILKKWLAAGYMEKRQLFPTDAGTPQGGIISPTLANLVLDGLEDKLRVCFGKTRKTGNVWAKQMVNYVRYADDFIVTGRSKELLEQDVMPVIAEFMKERGLTLSPEKTGVTHIDRGFDFLGQNIRKYNGKLLIKPSKTNVATFLKKIRSVVKGNKAMDQESLIKILNPMIQGWANYHQHIVCKGIFARVDHEIWCVLWQWAVRRHPQKSRFWIKERYFHSVGFRNWVFAVQTGEKRPDGRSSLKALRKAEDTHIRRHRKIKVKANPFDPQWEVYFEERASFRMLQSLKGRKKLTNLWLAQGRCCPLCHQLITLETKWHVHHIIRRVDGGTDENTNLVMVHPICHSQIHATGLKVVKPVRNSGL
ncbi:group II intron reverse transcriptase/maturase [Salmonella enterica]|uniref:Group II intron reverse transcriptase/maturase n=2 Tax=Salmonella enterica TaxID=28901 RepID=A0A3J6DEX2_SALER|nr:group II intron reverse transcriptase/maturase [Salmonella enterica]HAU3260734.1 group II intron reverse transcriptase/maturase [Salmonella enterica subsp. diarizonae]EAW3568466.1 group II intron reverse transcriptase/maturase [Salmonella enterica]EBO9593488.1 group II intron reverse transcriptase/maturase [Salmonella enterica]ECQ0259504.1 group II intron reverse transcriptase/maturase [Salmonella enterica]